MNSLTHLIHNMSSLRSLVESCEIDTRKALRQGGKAIAGTLPSWSSLARHCLASHWNAQEEKEMIEWGAAWAKRLHQHNPAMFLYWSSWSCAVNADLQQTGDQTTPHLPFIMCAWDHLNLDGYHRWVEGVLGKEAVSMWLSASDPQGKNHVWWATPSAKTMLKGNAHVVNWLLDHTAQLRTPMMHKVWKGLSSLHQYRDLTPTIDAIEAWSIERLKRGVEPLELSSLTVEQPLEFWKRVLAQASPVPAQEAHWISLHVDKELMGLGGSSNHGWPQKGPRTLREKWQWLMTQPKWTQALMHKPDVLNRMKLSWPAECRGEWAVEIEKSALTHQKKQMISRAEKVCPPAL